MPLADATDTVTTLVVAFEKQDGMTTEELREYYREEHVPVVTELPNLQGYDVTFPRDPEDSPFDGLARLHFEDAAEQSSASPRSQAREDPAAMGEAMDSEAAERMQADGAEFVAEGLLVQFVGESEAFV